MTLKTDPQYVLAHLDRIQLIADKLVRSNGDLAEQKDLAERIYREIVTVKATIETVEAA